MSPRRTLNAILVTVVIWISATTGQSNTSHDTPVDTGIVEGDTMSTRRSSSVLPPKDNNNPDDTNRNLVWTPVPAAPPADRVFPYEDPNFSSYAFPVIPGTMEKFGKLEEEPNSSVVEEGSGSNTVTLVATTPIEVATIATQTKDVIGDYDVTTTTTADEWVEVEVDVNSTKVKIEEVSSSQDPMYHVTVPTENKTNEGGSSLTTTTTTTTTTIITTIPTTTTILTTTATDPPTDANTLETLDAQTPPPNNSTMNTDFSNTTTTISNQTLEVDMEEGNSSLVENDSPTSGSTTTVPYPRTRPHRLQPPRRLTPAPGPGPSRRYPTAAPSTTTTDAAADNTMPHMATLPVDTEEGVEEEGELRDDEVDGSLAPHADVGSIPASATNAIIISSVIGGCAVVFFAVLMGFCMWRQRTRTPRRPIYRPPDLAGTGGLTAIGGPLPALQFQNPKCAL